MRFEDLFFAFLNLKSDTTVEVMKGNFSERIRAEACLEKYGTNEVVCFCIYGVKSQILTVLLKEDK